MARSGSFKEGGVSVLRRLGSFATCIDIPAWRNSIRWSVMYYPRLTCARLEAIPWLAMKCLSHHYAGYDIPKYYQ